MPRSTRATLPNPATLLQGKASAPDASPPASAVDMLPAGLPVGRRIEALRLDELWLETQPREIVPEEQLQRLIAEGRARPAALLEVLEWSAAADTYYADILAGLQGLADSIHSEGVLQPITVIFRGGRHIIHDGHRRSVASLLAGKETIPAIQVSEPTELEALAHALIVNLQRQDLTPLEKGAALLRLALLVGRRLAEEGEQGVGPGPSIEDLLGTDDDEVAAGERRDTVTGYSRDLAAQVRDRVCSMVGLQRGAYYRLLRLNRLTPEARALGRRLTESQLEPVAHLPTAYQVDIIALTARRNLGAREVQTLARVVRSGDADAVQVIMERLTREETPKRRTSVSWQGLLHAVPADVDRRLTALRAELAALAEPQCRARLETIESQIPRLRWLADELETIVNSYQQPPADQTT